MMWKHAIACFCLVLGLFSCGTDIDRVLTGQGGSSAVVGNPQFLPAPGTYAGPVTLTVSTLPADAQIYCSRNGSEPEPNSTFSTLYSGPILVSQTTLFRCRGFREGLAPSGISDGLYVIEGNGNGNGNGDGTQATVRLEFELAVDDLDQIRIQDGMINLVHRSGSRPEDPIVRIHRPDGTVNEINRWNLDPFHFEAEISCNFPENKCVSAALNLNLENRNVDEEGSIVPGSLNLIVGRESGDVRVTGPREVSIHDPAPNFSGYWFWFDYRYSVTE